MIAEGLPTQGNVKPGEYSYFKLYNNKANASIVITVTKLSVGELSLCVGKGSELLPMTGNCTWTGGNSLTIEEGDKAAGETMKGTYVIGVLGIASTTFSVTATTKQQPVIRLLNGQPQAAASSSKNPTYFFYNNQINTEVKIAITPIYGNGFVAINAVRFYD
jgi:hypothetical protein